VQADGPATYDPGNTSRTAWPTGLLSLAFTSYVEVMVVLLPVYLFSGLIPMLAVCIVCAPFNCLLAILLTLVFELLVLPQELNPARKMVESCA